MKHPKLLKLRLCAAFVALLAFAGAARAATGELTKSGSTWTGKVDGVTVYTGTDLPAGFRKCNESMNPLGGGTINLRASETISNHLGLWSGTKVNGNGYTITSNASGGTVACRGGANVGASNIKIAGGTPFGMYFRSCSGQTFSGISGGGGIMMRIDNCAGGAGSNFNGGSPTALWSSNHGVETYGINNTVLTTVTATDRNGGCGVLLNATSGAQVRNVNATRCNYGGGYAGYRLANSNNETYLTNEAKSTSCGRGFFALTGSRNSAVAKLIAKDCSGIGVWIQDCVNVRVVSGSVTNCSSCKSVSGSGSYANVACN